MIAKGTYVRGGNRKEAASRLTAHFKYLEHRPRDLALELRDDRRLFEKDRDAVHRKDAVNDVMEHTSARVSYHKIVLSPSRDEPVVDWRQWTRDILADLEVAQQKELHWYAALHHNTEHSHVHVVVAGAGYDWETGAKEPVRLSPEDYQQLRRSGHGHSEYAWEHHLERTFQEMVQQDRGREDEILPHQSREPFTDFDQGEFDR